ncbi:MAG: hypothetical protein ABIJ45_05785 [Candidatus Zixiibacteriota bacterium]
MSVGRGVWFKKRLVDDCWKLDIKELTSNYIFDLDWQLIMNWKSSWGKTASIGLDIHPPRNIRLYYTVTKNSGEKTDYDYITHYESTRCNYGGKRYWFLCPNCGRKCRILYLPPKSNYFACRKCYNLTYRSQQEGKWRWSILFDAIEFADKWQMKTFRSNSVKKRQRYAKKLEQLETGMKKLLALEKKKKRKKR